MYLGMKFLPSKEGSVITVAMNFFTLTVVLKASFSQSLAGTFSYFRHVHQALMANSKTNAR